MAGSGQVYTTVDAQAVNSGISTLSISGEIPGGDEGVTALMAWVNWVYDDTGNGGFTGKGWFWNDTNNDLALAWGNHYNSTVDEATSQPYANNENGFKKWLADTNPPNLDILLGNWDLKRKETFVNNNMNTLGVYPSDSNGCITIHA